MQLSEAGIEDLKEILAVQYEAYQSEADIYSPAVIPPMKQTLQDLETEYTQMTFYKAVIDNATVGSVRGWRQNNTLFVNKLIVRPDYQNRGIGRKLMELIEEANEDCSRFELFTGHKSVKNLHFYERLGYRRFKTTLINEHLSLIYMEKLLPKRKDEQPHGQMGVPHD